MEEDDHCQGYTETPFSRRRMITVIWFLGLGAYQHWGGDCSFGPPGTLGGTLVGSCTGYPPFPPKVVWRLRYPTEPSKIPRGNHIFRK